MKTSFLKRQSTWVCILLASFAIIAVGLYCGGYRFKAENYLPLLKHVHNDTETEFNLGFETVTQSGWPKGWLKWGYPSFNIQADSVVKHSGKYALRVEPKGEHRVNEFGAPTHAIPAIYAGKNITVKAFMRTEGVENPIGLMLRIDGNQNGDVLEFDNMQQRGITGTEEWEEYSVTLPLPESAKTIYIGAILSGKGKLWIDDFQLLIDDEDIAFAKLKPEKVYLAEEDTEFDKGSKITIETYTPQTVNNLELLCRIWGFLKYYHPAVATGDYNWDAELFRIMPSVIDVQNTDERNRIFVEWIDRLGKLKSAKNKNTAADTLEVKLQPDFAWMENPELGKTLSQKLKAVKDAARGTEHYYTGLRSGVGNPVFKNEKPYPEMKYYDDSGMRLLSLFRYWNMIEYFFPYKHLTDKDWNIVLGEFIPVFLDGNREIDYKLALLQLIASVNDTHANIYGYGDALNRWKGLNIACYKTPLEGKDDNYFSRERTDGTLNRKYEISFVEGRAVVTGIPDKDLPRPSALKNGDIITHIDGKPVEEIIEERKPYYPASNQPVQLRNIAGDLLRTNKENLSLQIIRNGRTKTCEIACSPITRVSWNNVSKTSSHRLLSPDVGYIWLETLKRDSVPAIMEKFNNTKGIIIDIRCYPSDFPIFALGSYLTPQPTEFVKFTNGNIEQPGKFTFTAPNKVGDNNDQCYQGKVVIIVNEQTQSSAEYHVMAFQTAPQAMVIGSVTAAADGNVSGIVLPGNVQTIISGIGVYYPDGRETQRVGVKLDMEVKPTIRGIIEGRDELLEKAIEMIKNP